MISRLRGTLLSRHEVRIEIATPGGVVYEVEVPLTVAERLPPEGEEVELRIVFVVKDDEHALYGLIDAGERELFQRLLGTKGVGAKMAAKMLSAYSAPRLAQILTARDVPALTQVSGIGKKKAERFVLDLADRMKDLELEAAPGGDGRSAAGAQAAVQGLIALGMSFTEAERAVRAVLDEDEPAGPDEIIRRALARR